MTKDNQDVFDILKASLWSDKKLNIVITENVKKELQDQAVEGLAVSVSPEFEKDRYLYVCRFVQMSYVQTEVIKLLSKNHIQAVVLKGTAAGLYYPLPYQRSYGDIDLLVRPFQYQDAIKLLSDNEYRRATSNSRDLTSFFKNGFEIEIHQRLPGLDEVPEGEYIYEYLLSGMDSIHLATINKPECVFPMLPWQQNGLELIWHIREHLYNGLGLRQIIDWMMFVHSCLLSDSSYEEYYPVLEQAGLLKIAKTITRMCQMYLGLDDSILWCKDIETELCRDLMEYVLNQGNFGRKRTDDKAVKVLSKYRNPISFLKQMQQKGIRDWDASREHVALKPLAWIYTGFQGITSYIQEGGIEKLRDDLIENQERMHLFDQLYGRRSASNNPYSGLEDSNKNRLGRKNVNVNLEQGHLKKIFIIKSKRRIKSIFEAIRTTPLRVPLYHIQNLYYYACYFSFGIPVIPAWDRENVERNVTFIYKSFNRQKQAMQLYDCIKKYYPNAHVIIADDSSVPLEIADLRCGDQIIHLPFNSGLSKGLIAALNCVETPFVMRLDDDMLLTPYSNIHKQVTYLQKHSEVDLIGIQAVFRNMDNMARRIKRVRMNRDLIIPAGTVIDGYEVVYKTPNVFLARSDSIRKVGYDPNIRMIDHHEFFYRAAGSIVCVFDEKSFVMHCHNRFEKEYYTYRNDYRDDVIYIKGKHGSMYG